MTAPKQEKRVYTHLKELDVKGHIGTIGAVFDFYAGTRACSNMVAKKQFGMAIQVDKRTKTDVETQFDWQCEICGVYCVGEMANEII